MTDVVITGMGIVSPLGVGRDDVWQAIDERRSGVVRLEHLAASTYPSPIGALVANFEPKQYIRPRKSLKVMGPDIRFAVAAAELAWQDAGLAEASLNPDRIGVVCGAGMICLDPHELAPVYQACMPNGSFVYDRWGAEGMKNLFPLWLLKYLPNMPGCHIGIARDARGPNNSISLGDVSSLLAISEAADVIRRGAADIIISGGTSSRIPIVDLVWRGGASVSRQATDPATACRPFDAGRDGLVNGEGAAQFVLETGNHAEARGARVIARVLGFGRRCESSARTLRPTGRAIRGAIQAAPRPGLRQCAWTSDRGGRSDRSPGSAGRVGRCAGDGPQELLRQSRRRRRSGGTGGEPSRL